VCEGGASIHGKAEGAREDAELSKNAREKIVVVEKKKCMWVVDGGDYQFGEQRIRRRVRN